MYTGWHLMFVVHHICWFVYIRLYNDNVSIGWFDRCSMNGHQHRDRFLAASPSASRHDSTIDWMCGVWSRTVESSYNKMRWTVWWHSLESSSSERLLLLCIVIDLPSVFNDESIGWRVTTDDCCILHLLAGIHCTSEIHATSCIQCTSPQIMWTLHRTLSTDTHTPTLAI